jgi:hypothetical protein
MATVNFWCPEHGDVEGLPATDVLLEGDDREGWFEYWAILPCVEHYRTRRVPVEYAVRLFDAGARRSSNVLVEETAAFLAAAWAHPSQPHRRKWWEK